MKAAQFRLDDVVAAFGPVAGVEAIVLGGSRGCNRHAPNADYDFLVLYDPAVALDVPALNEAARRLDDEGRELLLASPHSWTQYADGGGMLTVAGEPVDVLYRDVRRIELAIDDALAGRIVIEFQTGMPFGVVNTLYAAEIALARALHDPYGTVARLQDRLASYPPALRKELIGRFLWDAQFSLTLARRGIEQHDLAFVAGALFRAAESMAMVLFAYNQRHWLSERHAIAQAAALPMTVDDFDGRVAGVIAVIAQAPADAVAYGDALLHDVALRVSPLSTVSIRP